MLCGWMLIGKVLAFYFVLGNLCELLMMYVQEFYIHLQCASQSAREELISARHKCLTRNNEINTTMQTNKFIITSRTCAPYDTSQTYRKYFVNFFALYPIRRIQNTLIEHMYVWHYLLMLWVLNIWMTKVRTFQWQYTHLMSLTCKCLL